MNELDRLRRREDEHLATIKKIKASHQITLDMLATAYGERDRYRRVLEEIAAQVYTEDGMPKPLKFSAQSLLADIARDVLASADDGP